MTPFDPSSYSFDSVALNIVVVWFIQRLKLSSWAPWITEATPKVTKLISGIAAAVTAAGMSVNWNMDGGAGTLTIGGITYGSVILFLWLCVKNVAFQHVIYQVGFKPTPDQP